MKNLRGNHTSLTPLSLLISRKLHKKNAQVEISPGFIEAGIKAKTRSVILTLEESTVIKLVVISLSSKQSLRVYNSQVKEIKETLKEINIPLKNR